MTQKIERKLIKANVLVPFERYKIGDVAELPPEKAAALEEQGLVEAANKTAEKQIAKV